MSTCLRFFHTISIESIKPPPHLFTLKFLSYFVNKTSHNQHRSSQRNTSLERDIRKASKENQAENNYGLQK